MSTVQSLCDGEVASIMRVPVLHVEVMTDTNGAYLLLESFEHELLLDALARVGVHLLAEATHSRHVSEQHKRNRIQLELFDQRIGLHSTTLVLSYILPYNVVNQSDSLCVRGIEVFLQRCGSLTWPRPLSAPSQISPLFIFCRLMLISPFSD